jgi:multidrug efflux pump subunit AcrB
MRGLIRLAIRRPIGTIMIFAGAVILGAVAALALGTELLPELSIPKLIVSTSYRGLPTEEIRRLLTIPLEDRLASVKGVKRITSVSRDGLSLITLEFHWGEDVLAAAVKTREAVDSAYPSLPSEAEKPQVLPVDPGAVPVAIVGVRSREGDLVFARKMAEREVKTRLQRIEGVGSIVLAGGAVEEICLEVDQERSANLGLGIADIAGIVAEGNYDYPVGSITEGGLEYIVKTSGALPSPEALGALRLPGDKSSLRVSDLAAIERRRRERDSVFLVDGREAVGLSVMKRKGYSPGRVAGGIEAEVGRLREDYGADLEIDIVYDGSRFIGESIRNLLLSTLLGAAVAFVVLVAFLKDLRTAGMLMLSIPVASALTFLALRAFGRTINVMSLGGLALGVGMIVDNSVVVLENLKRRHASGREVDAEGVYEYTAELAGSNIGSTITSVIVFLPIIFVPGLVGALFTDLSLSVIFAQIASFLISITLMPVLFLLTYRGRRLGGASRPQPLARGFGRLLGSALRKPWRVFVALALSTAAGGACLPFLPFDFMPPQDNGELDVRLIMPYGTEIERAALAAREACGILLAIPDVERVYARVGAEPDDAQFFADPEERRESVRIRAIAKSSRSRPTALIAKEAESKLVLEGVQARVVLPGSIIEPLIGLGGGGKRIVASGESPAQARERASELVERMKRGVPGLDVALVPAGTRPEFRVTPDRASLARSGLSLADLAGALHNAVAGTYPSRMVMEGRDVDIRVRARPSQVSRGSELPGIAIARADGPPLRVSDFSAIGEADEVPVLYRRDRSDSVIVVVSDDGRRGAALRRLNSFSKGSDWLESLEGSALAESLGSIAIVFALVLALLYLALGAQFESFLLPALLLVALPLSFSGISIALALGGKSLSYDALLGIVVLFGVAVNNSILLYETYSERRERGIPTVAAVFGGTVERFQPIMITVLTTVLALLPVAIDPWKTSAQSGMAVAIIGGLAASTSLTLFVVPLLFIVYFHAKEARSAR